MKKILILSNNLETSMLFNAVLERDGYESLIVTTTQDALSHLENLKIKVFILILPLQESEENGWDFYISLKTGRNFSDIPVIVYMAWFPRSLPNPADYGDVLFTMPLDVTEIQDKVRELSH